MNSNFGRGTAHHIRLLVDQVPAMLAYWDSELRCRFANRAYERWFGVDPESLVGTRLIDLLGPALFALNEPYIRRALAGQQQVFERIVPGPGGHADTAWPPTCPTSSTARCRVSSRTSPK